MQVTKCSNLLTLITESLKKIKVQYKLFTKRTKRVIEKMDCSCNFCLNNGFSKLSLLFQTLGEQLDGAQMKMAFLMFFAL